MISVSDDKVIPLDLPHSHACICIWTNNTCKTELIYNNTAQEAQLEPNSFIYFKFQQNYLQWHECNIKEDKLQIQK